jgi:hypothetical protein
MCLALHTDGLCTASSVLPHHDHPDRPVRLLLRALLLHEPRRPSLARNEAASNRGRFTYTLRWCAAGMVEPGKQFRRVNSHPHQPRLRAALDAHLAASDRPAMQDEEVNAA